MNWTIRPARIEDVAAIVGLLADDSHARLGEDTSLPLNPRYTEAFVAIDRDPNQLLMLAEDATKIVGTFQLTFIANISLVGMRRCQLEAVRVHRDHRSRGLGAVMVGWAIDEAKRRGCGVLQLTSNLARLDAHRFYERLGFEGTHLGMKLSI